MPKSLENYLVICALVGGIAGLICGIAAPFVAIAALAKHTGILS